MHMSRVNRGFVGPSGGIVGGVGGGPGGLVAGVLEEEVLRLGGMRVGSGVAGEESEEGGRGEIGWNGAKKKDFFFFDLLFKEGIFFVFKSVNNKTFVNKKETEQEKMKLEGKKRKNSKRKVEEQMNK